MPQATTAATVYGPDSGQYFQPVTSISSQTAIPKGTRADRLEVRSFRSDLIVFVFKNNSFTRIESSVLRESPVSE